jgi:spore coat protein SA
LKIAIICTEKIPVPSIRGGAIQQYIDGVLPYLQERHQITVYCVQDPDLPNEEVNGNIRYIRVEGKGTHSYIKNVKNRLDDDFDLIHVHNRPLWVNILSEKLQESCEISLSLHNEMFLPNKITEDEARKCIARVKFITTVSNFVANRVKELYPEAKGKLHTVYSGVDIHKYQPVWSEEAALIRKELKEQYGLTDKRVILYVGRLSNKKGSHILIRAMEGVVAEYPDTALVIVGSKRFGENTEDSYVQGVKLMTETSNASVIFTGFLPPPQVMRHYYLGDIFVCASNGMNHWPEFTMKPWPPVSQ